MFEAFKIGVKLSLVNDVSHGLIAMAGDFNRAGKGVDTLIGKLEKMSTSAKAMFGGAVALSAGAGLAMMFKTPIEQANKYRKIQADILSNGAKASQLGAIQTWAGNDSVLRNLSINEKMAVGAESFALTRDAGRDNVEHTLKLAPILAKIESIAKNTGKEMSDGDKANFTKILELGGAFNNGADINVMADRFYRLMASGNGTMKPGVLLSILKADPNDLNKMSPQAMNRAEPLMQEMSAGFGVALRMLDNRMLAHVGFGGGTGGKLYAQLKKIGVFGKDDKVVDSQLLVSDYDMWLRKYMQGFYSNAGAKTDADKRRVDYLIGGSSGAKLIGAVQRQSDQMDASGASVIAQHGMDQDAAQKGGPLNLIMSQVHAQWENILTRIGLKVLPTVLTGLTEFSKIMTGVSAWVKENPKLTKFIALGAMFVSGILIVGGAIALVTGAVGILGGAFAAVALPITLTIAAIGGLIALGSWLHSLNWSGIWDGIKNSVRGFFSFIGDAWKHRPTWMGGDGANVLPQVGINQATKADRDYYAAAGKNSNILPKLGSVLPKFDTNQSTKADRDYYAAAGGSATGDSSYVRSKAQRDGNLTLNVDMGDQIKKAYHYQMRDVLSETGSVSSSTRFDFSMGQAAPGQTG
ncbi:hypothetical protein [Paraburkholderia sp. GAS348]|uniref:hypothetical protein n=1 Tax=Paraburkholderia sp. GAS348 TaxID=3035132 RepID=UPI003D1E444E